MSNGGWMCATNANTSDCSDCLDRDIFFFNYSFIKYEYFKCVYK